MTHVLDDTTPLRWRGAEPRDLEAVATLVSAVNYFDDPAESYDTDQIDAYAARPGGIDTLLLGWESDSLVAFAWNIAAEGQAHPREVRLTGGVHPAYRHQGIGRRLFAHQWEWAISEHAAAAPGEPLRLVAYADEKLTAKRGLYTRAGMTERRRFLDMRVRLADVADRLPALLASPAPPGVRYVRWDEAYCEGCRDAHNEAFGEMWQAAPVDADAWHEQTRRPAARPEWSWLAVDDDDRVVGYALNSDSGDGYDSVEGWTDRLGVRPAYSGRGIATALLARSLADFARAGAENGGLGLDTHGEAVGHLYRSVGYAATDTIVQYGYDHDLARARDDQARNDEKGDDR